MAHGGSGLSSSENYTVEVDVLYDENQGDVVTTAYIVFDNKVNSTERGTITLPTYYIHFDNCNLSGNLIDPNSSYYYKLGLTSEVRGSGYDLRELTIDEAGACTMQLHSYSDLETVYDTGVTFYDGNDTELTDLSDINIDWGGDTLENALSSNNGEYTLTISPSARRELSVSTGVSYNVLPYAGAILLTIAGAFILRKTSSKE